MPFHSSARLPVYRSAVLIGVVLAVGAMIVPPAHAAQAPVGLGTADSFGVLAGSGITNTGPTTITGDIGTFPTPSETGLGSVTLHGANHDADAVTQQAKPDLATAYNDAAGRSPITNVATELGGTTLNPGVYRSPTLGLTGTLTLDAHGHPNAQFIFLADSTLITASDSQVNLINGAVACNVVWKVGSSATFGTGTSFVGNVLSHTSITAQTAATFEGRLLARTGAVALDTNTISRPSCAGVVPTPTPTPSKSHTPTPKPTPTKTHKPSPTPKPTKSRTPSPTPSVSGTKHHHHHGGGGTGGGSGSGSGGGTNGGSGNGAGGQTGSQHTPSLTATDTSLPFTGLPARQLGIAGCGLLLAGAVILMSLRIRRRPYGRHQV